MPRRLMIRLAVALGGLVVLAFGSLAVLIAATSAPALPPPPLPTATAQPGPDSTPLGSPQPGPDSTPLGSPQPGPDSTPLSLVPPLPTATAGPALLALPGVRRGAGADPNGAVRALVASDPTDAAAATDLVYQDGAHPSLTNPACGLRGRWMLQVDPENVIGRPYSSPPSASEWERAATVIATATALCPASIAVAWFAHDATHPSSDRWTALLPHAAVAGIDGSALRDYALRHARQQ